ncbi:hypothetical protein ADLECEL_04430 [Adlercreutzia equolifaciens subsp. celatus]|nr:hypothetical protein ADLECEL_04430 [Adlercreutzia equolifaciens subsp. celatus]
MGNAMAYPVKRHAGEKMVCRISDIGASRKDGCLSQYRGNVSSIHHQKFQHAPTTARATA